MRIELGSIVTVSDMRKNYKMCREKAQKMGKVYIFKNNRADAVLSSIEDYRKLETVIDRIVASEKANQKEIKE